MAPADAQYRQQARLWSASVGISALINLLAVLLIALAPLFSGMLGLVGLDPGFLAEASPPPPPPAAESVAMIVPEAAPVSPRTPPPTAVPFARTSRDQESARPEKPAFIGDRNTTATSDAPATAQAPEMPGQAGREPRDADDVETTVSRYQDGDLAHDSIAPTPPAEPAPPAPEKMAAAEPPPSGSSPEPAANERQGDPAPPMEALATGPYQVDRQVKDESPPESPKPPAPERRTGVPAQENPANPAPGELPGPAAAAKVPGFRGNQRKTQLSGSITRQGRSALDVEDSPLGRYHASLSRAVEAEWEPACVRNEKYLTAGQIIVRFVLDPSGKVRSLTFVEEFGVGNIQKGFTSESIRTADIPPFPAELKKQLGGEPLEITYSFTF